jgi:hypothetical protein
MPARKTAIPVEKRRIFSNVRASGHGRLDLPALGISSKYTCGITVHSMRPAPSEA